MKKNSIKHSNNNRIRIEIQLEMAVGKKGNRAKKKWKTNKCNKYNHRIALLRICVCACLVEFFHLNNNINSVSERVFANKHKQPELIKCKLDKH